MCGACWRRFANELRGRSGRKLSPCRWGVALAAASSELSTSDPYAT